MNHERFNELFDSYFTDTEGTSSPSPQHPAFKEIVSMGKEALPALYWRFDDCGWDVALMMISIAGMEAPLTENELDAMVKDHSCGEMSDVLHKWCESNGYDDSVGLPSISLVETSEEPEEVAVPTVPESLS